MKYTVNIPQDLGQHPNASSFLSDSLRSLLMLLEQRGLPLVPLVEKKVTPELLERLLFQRVKTKSETTKFSKNQALNGLLTEVERLCSVATSLMVMAKLPSRWRIDKVGIKALGTRPVL
jgi:hypothetical protein